MLTTRRKFGTMSLGFLGGMGTVWAIDPIKRPGPKAVMKLSLAAYSFRKFLDLKQPTMSLFEFIDLASTMPLDAIELTSYYFAEHTDAYFAKLKNRAKTKNLAISGVPVGNNFCVRNDQKRQAEIDKVKTGILRASQLGAKTVRIFAGNLEKGDEMPAAQARVVAAIEECCDEARKHGILLALENHGGITATSQQLLALVKDVKSLSFGVNIDTGNFRTADPYADLQAIAPYAVVSQVKTEVFPMNKRETADLPRVIKILKDANFHGYVALEYEAEENPKLAVPKYVKELRKLIG